MSVAKPFRAEDWWIGKASLLIGLVYLFTIYFQIPFEHFGLWAMCSLVTIIGFASLGYLLNDFFDQDKDRLAGKKNFLLNKTTIQKSVYFGIALLMLFTPWYYLPFDTFTIVLIVLQLSLFLSYSMPGIRLKERGLLGLITDALYAHSIPAVMAVHTYTLISDKPADGVWVALLFAWQFCVGLRNILLHQLNDSDADQLSNTKTFTNKYGVPITNSFLNGLRSTELVLLLVLVSMLCIQNQWFFVAVVGIVLSLLLFLSMDKLNGYRFYFPNLLYDHLLPLSFIIILCISDIRFLLLFPIQLLLFSGKWLYALLESFELQHSLNAIKNGCYRVFHSIFAGIKLGVNWLVYLLFKVVGVDLIKEKTDAKGYILRQLNKGK
ncbi:MAG: UbiA family prenyltransferase [Chitinophagales bacterium]|nr:UbiA family prenyltransferase [Chitinophagales bacterium]